MIGALVGLLVLKIAVMAISAQLMGERKQDALACAFMLWQMGEFGFVLIALGAQHQLLTNQQVSFLIALGVLSM
ncbi:cation:proton antiporter, partial [Psychrobacter sp. 78a-MNA-CIBAN-0178]|uniref:cation:proton antiporter n=1 Tax=Psychrobacter sp. 78a-MNA-CIBAN-0178 TaxID=3140450 RepID=UPI0033179272